MNIGLRILAHRRQQKLSLRNVAQRTDLSISFLSQVERDLAAPSINSLKRISQALGVTVAELLTERENGRHPILRKRDRPAWSLAHVTYELLAVGASRKMEPQLITYDPHCPPGEHAVAHDGEEFCFVLSGRLSISLDDDETCLEAGDCAYFSSQVPHRMWNAGDEPCRCLLVVTPASF
ncbi:MAG: helix-turn-helix transcriptional regulator [Chloroflexi bacterium]|nr:helix-turn-helix transcriptional regulator [Chloroflexota bacterium]